MVAVEIAHTDGAHLALPHVVLHYLPGVTHAVLHRPMNQKQVDVAGIQSGEALVDRLAHCLTAIAHYACRDLGSDENLTAQHVAVGNAQSYLRFILIHLCRIDMSESCLQSQTYILPSRLSP